MGEVEESLSVLLFTWSDTEVRVLLKFASESKEVCSFTHYQKSPKLCKLAVNDCQTHSAKFLKIILEPGIKSYVCFSFGTAGSLCGVISCNPAAIVWLNNVFPSFLGFLGISFLTNQTRPGNKCSGLP